MVAFNYSAIDLKGKRKKGVLEADGVRQVRQKLREQGLIPLQVDEIVKEEQSFSIQKKWQNFFKRRLRSAELSLITRQLATLISARIPLDEALMAVANQNEKRSVKSIILGVRSKVLSGHTLAAGLEDFPSIFPKIYRTTVASGEKSGQLGNVLLKLAEYTEKQHSIRRKVQQALIYPSLMMAVSMAIVIFLLTYVVPKIIAVFAQTKQTLPLITKILLSISYFFQHDGFYFLFSFIFFLFLCRNRLKKNRFRYLFDRLLLKLPILGKSIRTVNGARFARTFGILSSASVPVIEAMKSAGQLMMPLPMRYALDRAVLQVQEGISVHRALQKTQYFSPMFIHLVASGEVSGQLEMMLQRAADQQQADVETIIDATLALFEPCMILVMGGIVLFIVLAIMLPIFALDQMGGFL